MLRFIDMIIKLQHLAVYPISIDQLLYDEWIISWYICGGFSTSLEKYQHSKYDKDKDVKNRRRKK